MHFQKQIAWFFLYNLVEVSLQNFNKSRTAWRDASMCYRMRSRWVAKATSHGSHATLTIINSRRRDIFAFALFKIALDVFAQALECSLTLVVIDFSETRNNQSSEWLESGEIVTGEMCNLPFWHIFQRGKSLHFEALTSHSAIAIAVNVGIVEPFWFIFGFAGLHKRVLYTS